MLTQLTHGGTAPPTTAAGLIARVLEAEAETLLSTLRLYVLRAGLARGEGAHEAAVELLTELAVEAIEHAERFDLERRPMAWLLGIAANLVRRRQVENARRARREPLLHDLLPAGDAPGDDDLLERLAGVWVAGPEEQVVADAQTRALLALVSPEDAEVLRLAVVNELSGEEVARALGITPGAARVRLHRARLRLREAWVREFGASEGGAR